MKIAEITALLYQTGQRWLKVYFPPNYLTSTKKFLLTSGIRLLFYGLNWLKRVYLRPRMLTVIAVAGSLLLFSNASRQELIDFSIQSIDQAAQSYLTQEAERQLKSVPELVVLSRTEHELVVALEPDPAKLLKAAGYQLVVGEKCPTFTRLGRLTVMLCEGGVWTVT